MPKEVKVQVFRFAELSKKVQQKLIDNERQFYYEDGIIDESLRDRFTEYLEERGLPTGKICYSLSSSQGDGVAFYGKIDLEDYFEKNKLAEKFPYVTAHVSECSMTIVKVGHHSYDHYNTMELEHDLYFDENNETADLFRHMEEHIKDVSRELEKEGYEILYSYDDDYFRDWLQEQPIWYFAEGRVHERNG